MSAMLESLKEFVRKPTSQNQAEDTVVIHVTHANLKQHFIEIRVDLHVLIILPYYLFSSLLPHFHIQHKTNRVLLKHRSKCKFVLLRSISRSLWIPNLVSISLPFRNADMSECKWINGVDIESLLIHTLQGLVYFLF
jgi:hypothetical protein